MKVQEMNEIRNLTADELDAVSDGVAGGRTCTPPFNPADPRFLDWVREDNPWLEPGSTERRLGV
jgi:hypothetical protein